MPEACGPARQIAFSAVCISPNMPLAVITSDTTPIIVATTPEPWRQALPMAVCRNAALCLSHRIGEFADQRAARGFLAIGQAGDGDHDQQHRPQRGDGIKRNRRPTAEGAVLDEGEDALFGK